MVKICSVKGCKSESFALCGISFHSFPKDEQLKAKWLEAVGGEITCKNPVVCSRHFKREHFKPTIQARLTDDAVPYIVVRKIGKVPPGPHLTLSSNAANRPVLQTISTLKREFNAETDNSMISMKDDLDAPAAQRVHSGPHLVLSSNATNRPVIQTISTPKRDFNAETDNSMVHSGPHLVLSSNATNRPVIQTISTPKRDFNAETDNSMKAEDDLEGTAAQRVCLVCLAADRSMLELRERLHQAYTEVTGVTLGEEPGLPRRLCWECGARALAAARFRDKARRAHRLLAALRPARDHISLRDVASINRRHYNLESELSSNHFHTNDDPITTNSEEITNECNLAFKLDIEGHDNYIEESEEVETCGETFFCDDGVDNSDILNITIGPNETNDLSENGTIDGDDVELNKSNAKVKTIVEKKPKGVKRKRNVKSKAKPKTTMDECKSPTNINDNFTVTTLTFEEQVSEIQSRKDSSNYKEAAFKCETCYRGFDHERVYEAHVLRHTEAYGAFECKICKYRQKSARCQRQHMTNSHTARYSCKECSFVTQCKSVAANHARYHAGARYQCPHCPRYFNKPSTYYGHMRLRHTCAVACDLCGHTFISRKGVDLHKKSFHLSAEAVTLEGPYCETCDVRFVSEEAHARHLKLSSRHSSHSDPNGIRNDPLVTLGDKKRQKRRPNASDKDSQPVCELCGIKCNSRIALGQHFRRAHPNRTRTKDLALRPCTYMCEQCGNKYQSLASLTDHKRAHTGERGYACGACGKRFVLRALLRSHARVHDPARRTHPCVVCGKRFSTSGNRHKHMLIHTGLKPFECEACGKFFLLSVRLRAHIDHVHNKKPWPKRRRRAPTED